MADEPPPYERALTALDAANKSLHDSDGGARAQAIAQIGIGHALIALVDELQSLKIRLG